MNTQSDMMTRSLSLATMSLEPSKAIQADNAEAMDLPQWFNRWERIDNPYRHRNTTKWMVKVRCRCKRTTVNHPLSRLKSGHTTRCSLCAQDESKRRTELAHSNHRSRNQQ